MPFKNVPVKNPGRYFEQFVKVVQPKSSGCNGGGGSNQALAKSPINSGWQPVIAESSKKQQGGQSWS